MSISNAVIMRRGGSGRGNGIGAGRGRDSENEEVATSPVAVLGLIEGHKGCLQMPSPPPMAGPTRVRRWEACALERRYWVPGRPLAASLRLRADSAVRPSSLALPLALASHCPPPDASDTQFRAYLFVACRVCWVLGVAWHEGWKGVAAWLCQSLRAAPVSSFVLQ
eukprot:CAMPEP_0198678742 /NCGR_PEP_ID=MMETSP1468-20131203/1370_1 /TAXON_ID=1461545 /ORGANISM="Mantoniella sp, Strain CCMP1436" /LENGTH=165 /DNA_ID=CAMNT_0044416489 /DNA_START=107 /DNA_END=602 /DNA_ORIENTATION=+